MKFFKILICIFQFSTVAFAQQTIRPDGMGGWTVQGSPGSSGPCAGMSGTGQAMCMGMQQGMQINQAEQQRMLQEQQIENQRLQNEILKQKIESARAAEIAATQQRAQVEAQTKADFLAWKTENPWYDRDKARTEYANLYGKQLRQERPNLVGKAYLDAVTAKVEETFGKKK